MKTCSQCQKEKDLNEFYIAKGKHIAACKQCSYQRRNKEKDKNRKQELVECSVCRVTVTRAYYTQHLTKPIHLRNMHPQVCVIKIDKKCPHCNTTRPMADFYMNGCNSWCCFCCRAAQAIRRRQLNL